MKPEAIGNSSKTTVIEPASARSRIDLRELWTYRELLSFLVIRDIKVKYKQTFFGVAWAIMQPFVQMIVFSLFFGKLAKIPSEGLPYPVFVFTALLPWNYFQSAFSLSSTSLVSNGPLLSKIYFPRMLLPVGATINHLLDFAVSVIFLFLIMAFYGMAPTARILWALPFVVLAMITAIGCGLGLSAINVKYRDVQHTVPFLVQIWFFLTPVVYPSSLLPEGFRILYGLNPMVAVIEGFRWAVAGMPFPSVPMMAVSILVSLTLLGAGAYYFLRTEREFADVV